MRYITVRSSESKRIFSEHNLDFTARTFRSQISFHSQLSVFIPVLSKYKILLAWQGKGWVFSSYCYF